jgi:hypothetical protein
MGMTMIRINNRSLDGSMNVEPNCSSIHWTACRRLPDKPTGDKLLALDAVVVVASDVTEHCCG